ncbi:phytanoyl-CoA dioxygenase family protein [Pseudoalteromonas sp. PS5]|uniref:phytanoyl-CoA dioxygenase family protein n=1 Tax=Pseudoalteromonas sp. PS5 TaxID=1437473 RepID=UPI000FFE39FA|nr:phytanoyl-CoA dioxygenase family protein [Pseudoalteromonas sp. PS5]RXF00752.1 hypothetical protein D9603_14515 [Pseudoalteromonas sp. PS5]
METQLQHTFDKYGFIKVEAAFEAQLFKSLQAITTSLLQDAQNFAKEDKCLEHISASRHQGRLVVSRINDLFKFQSAYAELLAHPSVIGLAEKIIGEPVAPVYESLLIKDPADPYQIGWHRDMNAGADERIITMGIYLDDAQAQQGALQVLPGSHLAKESVLELKEKLEKQQLTPVDVPVKAGDILIHHVNTLHCSGIQHTKSMRRTLYFEFRAISHLQQNSNYSTQWLDKRLALLAKLQKGERESAGHNLVEPDFYSTFYQIEPADYGFNFG